MNDIETWSVRETSRTVGGQFLRYDGVTLCAFKHQPYHGRVGPYSIRISNLVVQIEHPTWWIATVSLCHADGKSTALRQERGERDDLLRSAVKFVRDLQAKQDAKP